MRRRLPVLLLVALTAAWHPAAAADAPKGWFGLALSIDAGGSWFSPTLRAVTVAGVTHGSPAAAAGVVSGDQVLEVDGVPVAGAKADAVRASLRKSVGDKLRLKVRRGADPPRTVTLVAAPWPAPGP